MPTYIIKPSRDEDFYVWWSTVVDAPIRAVPRLRRWGRAAMTVAQLGIHEAAPFSQVQHTSGLGS